MEETCITFPPNLSPQRSTRHHHKQQQKQQRRRQSGRILNAHSNFQFQSLIQLVLIFLLSIGIFHESQWNANAEPLECSTVDDVECCNGIRGLCSSRANEIMYGMVHNAMSSLDAGFILYPNNENDPIVESLDFGFRALSLDLCSCNGVLQLCHGGSEVGCGVGSKDPIDTFVEINDWLIQNPRNVIMIMYEINQEAGGPVSLDDINGILDASGGFKDRLYDHTAGNAWPTLQELIDLNKQVLFFYTRGPNGSGEHPSGVHFFYEYTMATDWKYATVDELREDTVGSCTIRSGGSDSDFFLMNAFVTEVGLFGLQFAPSQEAAEVINTAEFLEPLTQACENFQGTRVNIISVDFWKSGNLPAFVEAKNIAIASAPKATMSPQPSNIFSEAPSFMPSSNLTITIDTNTTVPPAFNTTYNATEMPSMHPTAIPTMEPSSNPTLQPTSPPSDFPSEQPSSMPSALPTIDASSSGPRYIFRSSWAICLVTGVVYTQWI